MTMNNDTTARTGQEGGAAMKSETEIIDEVMASVERDLEQSTARPTTRDLDEIRAAVSTVVYRRLAARRFGKTLAQVKKEAQQ